jgi:hypothetical protein
VRPRIAVAYASAAGVPLGLAWAMVPLRSHLPNTTVALALAVCVAALSTLGTRLSAFVAALSAGVGFDVFHTRPYGSFAISRAPDVETALLLVAVAIAVGQLAARSRLNRQRAFEASHDLARIHGVAEMVSRGDPPYLVVGMVAHELTDMLALRDCRFDSSFAERPGPFIERDGGVSWGAIRWGFRTIGLPTSDVTLVVQYRGLPMGRFVLSPSLGARVTRDRLLVVVALADQAGAALAGLDRPTR